MDLLGDVVDLLPELQIADQVVAVVPGLDRAQGQGTQGAELQALEVGAMVPFAPGMGFRVDVLVPGHALVLYGDDQVAQAPSQADGSDGSNDPGPGLKLAGLLSDANMRSFTVSWAFVLEPVDGMRTRVGMASSGSEGILPLSSVLSVST